MVEAIRTLMVARRSARRDRTATINQMRALVATGPDDLTGRFASHRTIMFVTDAAGLRPRGGDTVGTRPVSCYVLAGRRAVYLADEIDRLYVALAPLLTERASSWLALPGVGPDTAAILLIAAGDHPDRLRSEAAWAHLCGVAPIPASSGKITRRRLNPGGDRQANHALWRIVLSRMKLRTQHPLMPRAPTARGLTHWRSSAARSGTSPGRR